MATKKKRLNINKAIKREGALTAKAKAHGMTVNQFARYVLAHPNRFSKLTRQQAQFYLKNLKPIIKKNTGKKRSRR